MITLFFVFTLLYKILYVLYSTIHVGLNTLSRKFWFNRLKS